MVLCTVCVCVYVCAIMRLRRIFFIIMKALPAEAVLRLWGSADTEVNP